MTILDLSTIGMLNKFAHADICIIGAGIAGLIVATKIASAGKKVIVVESGASKFDKEVHKLNSLDFCSSYYSREFDGRYRGLGGTSSRWGGRIIPIPDSETHRREHLDMPEWPIDLAQLDSYGEEIERLLGVAQGSYEEVPVSDWKPFASRSRSMEMRWAKCPSFRNCNIATVLREQLKSSRNIEIWLNSTVCGFDLDKEAGRLKGIHAREFHGSSLHVSASHFVVAAGAIDSTRILLLLDASAEGRIFGRSSVLGHYFQDHLKLDVATIDRTDAEHTNQLFAYRYVNSTRRDLHMELTHSEQARAAAASSFAYIAMDLRRSPLAGVKTLVQGLQRGKVDVRELLNLSHHAGLVAKGAYWRFLRKQLFVPAGIDFRVMLCAEQLPHWSNRISLSTRRDRFGLPKALLQWKPMPSEEHTFRVAIDALSSHWQAIGLSKVCPLKWRDEVHDPQSQLTENAEPCAHPSGSTRMGTDANKSVVDAELRCHAIPNVSVASASVFPTAGSANPTFTIMKMACLMADRHIAQSKAGIVIREAPREPLAQPVS